MNPMRVLGWVCVVVTVGLLGVPASAGTIEPVGLDWLLADPERSVVSGDKEFYNFHGWVSTATGGANVVQASQVLVTPTYEQGEYGLLFNSAWLHVEYNGGTQSQDVLFDFYVRVVGVPWLIEDNTLKLSAASTHGTGRVTIIEAVKTLDEQTLLADKSVTLSATENRIYDHQTFTPTAVIHVSKDIALISGDEPDSDASVSHFVQTFSQTPEPATWALLALGGLGGVIGRAVARKRRVEDC